MTYAVVESATGRVVNVVQWDGETIWSPPAGHDVIPGEGSQIGGTWNGSFFTTPPDPLADRLAADAQRCRDYYFSEPLDTYLANASPTNAQSLEVIKETVRTLRSLIRIVKGLAT